jgi:hypothetical protein
MSNDMRKLGELWKGRNKEGQPFLFGVADQRIDDAIALLKNGGRLLVLANNRKREGKRDPDCELFVVPKREKGR